MVEKEAALAGSAFAKGGPTARPVTVLLIDDQAIVGESVRRMLASETDIQFHFCQDPTQALKIAEEIRPTVILQDLVMPEIDGLMLVKFFRANPATRDTPMVVLSSKEEPIIKAQAFGLGANDYLVKLPDKLELIARVRYHSRAYLNLLERNEAYRQLEESQRLLAEEVAQAARYVQSLLPEKLSGAVRTDWLFVPSTQLGGDMFGYHWLDSDHLAIYLLDVSGHGVGSSLLAVSATNVLAAQSLPNTDFRHPGNVLTGLNETFKMEKQNGKYFTIFYAVYRRKERELAFANAGHPPAFLFTGPTANAVKLHRLESQGPMIGACPDLDFDTVVIKLDSFARLLLYSDGVCEISRPDESMWKFEEFAEYVCSLPQEGGLEPILGHVRAMHASEVLDDDFSLVEVTF
jgi:sigma-B regulation protein RsbU (phosphoserine phosphatase)